VVELAANYWIDPATNRLQTNLQKSAALKSRSRVNLAVPLQRITMWPRFRPLRTRLKKKLHLTLLQYITKVRNTYTYITEIEKNLGECMNNEKK
jgi:hypothetical protein